MKKMNANITIKWLGNIKRDRSREIGRNENNEISLMLPAFMTKRKPITTERTKLMI